jgi:DNA gyrase/topoisomerase IV subunit B
MAENRGNTFEIDAPPHPHAQTERGKNLYNNIWVALCEFIDNSIAARSTKIEVQLHKDQVVIEDDGIGMGVDDLKKFATHGLTKESSEDTTNLSKFGGK